MGALTGHETELEIAERHVRDAEARIARQIQIVNTLKDLRYDTTEAEKALGVQYDFLQLAREHLAMIQQDLRRQSGSPPRA